jgi:methylphosphotriester-DNA--protein-cysteine methyltransferase
VAYRELPPPPELASHVACLWIKTGANGRIVPDGCADLVWTGSELIVAGPSTRAFAVDLAAGATKLGLRFRVGAAGPALGLPARELVNRSPRLADVWRGGDELSERVGEARTAGAALRAMADALARRLRHAEPVDAVVRGAVLGVAAEPRARIAELGDGLGERQLRRRFDAAVGYAPKTLAGVLRLQRFLALARCGGGLARLAADAGYADQAHLTRECARLTGLPPAALLADGVSPAGEGELIPA